MGIRLASTTPGLRLLCVLLLGLGLAALTIWTAARQPTLGIDVPAGGGIALSSPDDTLTIEPLDLAPEPGELASYGQYDRFIERQARLAAILRAESVTVSSGAESRAVVPAPRPVSSLPTIFWIQLAVGFGALVISGWVWALRPHDLATGLFAISGLATLAFTFSAAIYSTRDIALPPALFVPLFRANLYGSVVFGIAMIALFLVYPVRLPWWRPLMALASVLFLAMTAAFHARAVPWGVNGNLITLIEMVGICLAIGAQFAATRQRPEARAVLTWFGLSVIIGAGAFIALSAMPLVFGADVAIEQGYAFLFFLVIYLGLAAGLRRYRLFELGEWAFRILFYMSGAALLVTVDVLLTFGISMEPTPAFGLSLLAVAFLYLPFRDALARWFLRRGTAKTGNHFRHVVDIALSPAGGEQQSRWRQLLLQAFDPLVCESAGSSGRVEIRDDGLTLALPSIGRLPAMRLQYAYGGRKLFGPRDLARAEELVEMLGHAIDSRSAHEKGVAEERARIARDIHDNVGAQLLGALHSQDVARKDTMIRETLTDLREIINDASARGNSLDVVLADLRVESAERLAAAGIDLDWSVDSNGASVLAPPVTHALRSIVREAVSNVTRHSGARHATVRLSHDDGALLLRIEDDGVGLDVDNVSGNGLANMEERVAALRGTFELSRGTPGTHLAARFPLELQP